MHQGWRGLGTTDGALLRRGLPVWLGCPPFPPPDCGRLRCAPQGRRRRSAGALSQALHLDPLRCDGRLAAMGQRGRVVEVHAAPAWRPEKLTPRPGGRCLPRRRSVDAWRCRGRSCSAANRHGRPFTPMILLLSPPRPRPSTSTFLQQPLDPKPSRVETEARSPPISDLEFQVDINSKADGEIKAISEGGKRASEKGGCGPPWGK